MKGIRIFTLRRSENLQVLADGSFVGELSEIAFAVTGTGLVEVSPGWLYCNGALISRVTYKRLYDEIGFAYSPTPGADPGSNQFYLPDMCGRSALPWADGQTGADRVANAGALGNATVVGGVGGHDVVALSPTHLPPHVHSKGTLSISGGGAHGHSNGTLYVLSSTAGSGSGGIRSNNGGAITVNIPVSVDLAATTHNHGSLSGVTENGTTAGLGAGTPTHNNIPPHLPATGMVIRS